MQIDKNIVLWRHDTFLGVCQAIGQDFGFNPDWLRVVFASALLFNPTVVLGIYGALALIVLASRLIFPARRADAGAAVPAVEAEARRADNDRDVAEIAAAA
ncbi:PspC domain-containing protein [Rhizorhabdus sp. FW153]|uniref:PspC domain-containing protein n=1 Tax=Rhizorhabdus sp. FW153 TaxID=3400216 RepID=UPI003CF30CAE